MPAAVGIALGKPDAKVIGLIGDGSSMYSIQALVERRAACLADHVHRSQEPALCRAAGVRAGVRLRPGRAAGRNRAAGYRFRGAGAWPGMPWREREQRAALARRADRCAAGIRSDARGSGRRLKRFITDRQTTTVLATPTRGGTMSITSVIGRSAFALIAACAMCRSRGCADLAGQAGQVDRQFPARRRRRHACSRHCAGRLGRAQAAGRGRESSRGERRDRRRCGRQVACRRLHVPRHLRRRDDRRSVHLPESSLRHAERPDARGVARRSCACF